MHTDTRPETMRPNILLITADQFRWDALGCMGNMVIRTPNLDALAARGMRFCNAFTPNPICVPARAAIMTGNYPQVCTGRKNNAGRIRDGQPLLTEVLKAVGYRTYALGKLHFVPYAPPGEQRLVHGFEHVEWTESGRILAQFDPCGELEGVEIIGGLIRLMLDASITPGDGEAFITPAIGQQLPVLEDGGPFAFHPFAFIRHGITGVRHADE